MKNNIIKQSVIAAAVTLGLSVISISTVNAEKVVSLIDLNVATPDATTKTPTTSLSVRRISKTMSDGIPQEFWVFCQSGSSCLPANSTRPGPTLPGPTLTMDAGTSTDVLLNMMMAPQETTPIDYNNAYIGHTVHLHGLDMESQFDGVPETYQEDFGGPTKTSVELRSGFTYKINSDPGNMRVDTRFVGSHMYHCHVHTVKHLEMGMYGAFVVKSEIDPAFINNTAKVKFDDEWIMMVSTVDPKYHTTAAQGDSDIFTDYNPEYFLINGEEAKSDGTIKPELSKIVNLVNGQPRNIVMRLMGIHSTNAIFSIPSGANNSPVSFTVYNRDGFALLAPKTVKSVELSPGQTMDVMLTVSAAAVYNPQFTFTTLRDSTKPFSNTFANTTVLKSIVKTELVVTAN